MDKEYRQVVSDMSITSSKSYNDFLYGWLVLNAHMEDGVAYLWKRDFVLSKMEKELGITRKTLSKQFSFLVKEGLIQEEDDRWVITPLGKKGFWIEVDKLRRLIEIRQPYAITVYVYLMQNHWGVQQSGRNKVPILLDKIKAYIGLATTTRSNNKVITNLFDEFSAQGLLKCELVYNTDRRTHFYLVSGVDKENYF